MENINNTEQGNRLGHEPIRFLRSKDYWKTEGKTCVLVKGSHLFPLDKLNVLA